MGITRVDALLGIVAHVCAFLLISFVIELVTQCIMSGVFGYWKNNRKKYFPHCGGVSPLLYYTPKPREGTRNTKAIPE